MTTYIIKTHSRHSRVIGIVFFINWCPLNLCVDSTADVLDNCCCSFCVFVQYLQCASLCRYAHWLAGIIHIYYSESCSMIQTTHQFIVGWLWILDGANVSCGCSINIVGRY